ncbi:hypothetical protein CASFOL_005901 [Castilleja foliolosa]|uniref:Cytochrome P450 n=1 Tax=Castilleja foliolosa TaxID=1961234 RepID=A0ABD3E4U1_9LAMI
MSPVFADYPSFLLVLISLVSIFITILISKSQARKSKNLPPGPFQFFIIGNILALGTKPHRSLAKLSRKHGPIMSLKLGNITAIVISSPETAKSVFTKNDLLFSGRKPPLVTQAFGHHELSMGWLPVGSQWRKLRKICKEQMFTTAGLDATQGLRKDKLDKLREHIRACSESGRAVDIGGAAFTTSLNLISSTLFSLDMATFDSEAAQEMKDVVWGVMKCVGKPNLADYFPVLERFDPQGVMKETGFYFGKLLEIFDRIFDDKMKVKRGGDDLLEELIHLNQRDELSRNEINHLLLDLFTAGTDTTSGTVEWAMTELLRNPDKLLRLQKEIKDNIIEGVQESDIPRLPYLQAVVKETFRLHPTAPLLLPHKADTDVEINGYTIPKDAQILVNVWASGRDPSVWPNADMFVPERFLDREIDFRGQDFELIPFGAGRRICPGLPMANRMVHLMLATFVVDFGWQLEEGVKLEELNMDEKFGLTLQKAIPLKAVPMKL